MIYFFARRIVKFLLALVMVIFSFSAHCQSIIPWDLPDFYLENLKSAFTAVVKGETKEIVYYSHKLEKLEKDFIHWYKLYKSCPSYREIEVFMKSHEGWPTPNSSVQSKEIVAVHYLDKIDYHCNGKDKKSVFLNYDVLSNELRLEFIDKLLRKKDIKGVQGLIEYLTNYDKKIINARISLLTNQAVLEDNFLSLFNDYQKDFTLIYDYILWYIKNRKVDDKIIEIITLIPFNKKYCEDLWNLYKLCVRSVVYNKQYQYYLKIYNLLNNWSEKTKNFLHDSYWLSGWLSFEFLNDKRSAYHNFEKMYKIVRNPVSLSKAAYWAARVSESEGNLWLASRWYKISSSYKTTFYGQLSLLKTGVDKISFTQEISYKSQYYLQCKKNVFAKIYYLAMKINEFKVAEIFSDYVIKNATHQGELAIIAELSLENNFYGLSIKFAKLLERADIILAKSLFPSDDSYFDKDYFFDQSVVLSIIRQESRFDSCAKSRVGALGLMQLMPKTAEEVAKDLGISYKQGELLNPKYNIKLGSKYFKKILKNYDNSLILAVAAYNSGPQNVNKWIRDLGDPRKIESIEGLVSWIETIPFTETRDYVKRIIENYNNYRNILNYENKNTFSFLEEKFFKL